MSLRRRRCVILVNRRRQPPNSYSHVYAYKGNKRRVCCFLVGQRGSNRGDKKLRHRHANRTGKQERSAAPAFDEVQPRDSADHIDDRRNHGGDEGVADTGIGEERGTVVEDEIDTPVNWLVQHLLECDK